MDATAMLPPSLRIDAARQRVFLSPTDDVFVQNPYPAYAAIRAAAPVFFWEEYGFWCLAGHEDVAGLFRDRRFGREVLHVATRAELGWPDPEPHTAPFDDVDANSMLEREPPVHTRLRGLVNRAFVSRRIEALRPRIGTLAQELIDRFAHKGRIELGEAFATPIPLILIAEMLGVPTERGPDLLDWSHKMVAMYQFNRSRAAEDAAVAATEAFVAFLKDTVAERRRRPGDDLISLLIGAGKAGDRLSEDELISTVILLLNAGHEATVHMISNAVKLMLERGIDAQKAFATPASTEAHVEEALRLDPPLHLFTRYALEPVTLGGISLQTGDQVGLLLAAANRDPQRFSDPDRLDPGRERAPHMSFGAGIHFCLGAPLARLELQVALPILFARLPGVALDGTPRYRDSYHFHGLEALHLAWPTGSVSRTEARTAL